MLIRLFFFLASLSPVFEEKLWKWWYQRLSSAYRKSDWRFMNYGFDPLDEELPLWLHDESDEENRLFIQLYHFALNGVSVKGKHVLEVGSGRGGGADYISRYLAPAKMIGIDFSKNAIDLCQQFYHLPNLTFQEGNAENLPFENDLFDVVLNIESSHCYGNMEAFIAEVRRVLKPGGVFVWADLRTRKAMEVDDRILMGSDLHLVFKKEITANILKALEKISDHKAAAIKERVPFFWRSIFSEFAGVQDSAIYRGFQEGKMVYWYYRFFK